MRSVGGTHAATSRPVTASDAAAPGARRLPAALLDQVTEPVEVGLGLAGRQADRRPDPLADRLRLEGHLELDARRVRADRLEHHGALVAGAGGRPPRDLLVRLLLVDAG